VQNFDWTVDDAADRRRRGPWHWQADDARRARAREVAEDDVSPRRLPRGPRRERSEITDAPQILRSNARASPRSTIASGVHGRVDGAHAVDRRPSHRCPPAAPGDPRSRIRITKMRARRRGRGRLDRSRRDGLRRAERSSLCEFQRFGALEAAAGRDVEAADAAGRRRAERLRRRPDRGGGARRRRPAQEWRGLRVQTRPLVRRYRGRPAARAEPAAARAGGDSGHAYGGASLKN